MTEGSSQGLFVIVAVVIFGIFVLISYLLFRENLKTGLGSIFEDSLDQANENLKGEKNEYLNDVKSSREDSTYLYAKIREENKVLGETEIWVQAEKLSDGTLNIYQSSTEDRNYGVGTSEMTGNLFIPKTIDGKIITTIDRDEFIGAFRDAVFTGELKLPEGLKYLGNHSFHYSTFTGSLKLPDGLISLGNNSLLLSTFTGELKIPEGFVHFGRNSLQSSKFTGELHLPKTVKSIGTSAFIYSEFTGTLDVSNIEYIQSGAFFYSKIDEVIRGNVEMYTGSEPSNIKGIHNKGIKLSDGYYYVG